MMNDSTRISSITFNRNGSREIKVKKNVLRLAVRPTERVNEEKRFWTMLNYQELSVQCSFRRITASNEKKNKKRRRREEKG
ncbi:hypothetical protein V1477_015435 [Vespula maculifrons]|uniref:Uncharacterized protein n=1 Tax=Vespula maculifrons TaxID=7453 RepID=A0ABD2BFS4_VESMC